MYKKVLLCLPPSTGIHGWSSAPPTGIGYLEEVLERNGIVVNVLDLRLGHTVKDLLKRAEKFCPDLVGVSTLTYRYGEAYELINRLKRAGHRVVIGGPHVSVMRSKVLEECEADFAIKHEGEYKLLSLCRGENLGEIDGLIYRKSGRIIENKDGEFIEDLDSIPFPRYQKFELGRYMFNSPLPIISSRGCPYSCTFCSVKVVAGRRYRPRSARNVVAELEYWYQKGHHSFSFQDDNFTFDRQRVFDLCDLIEERGLSGLTMECGNGIRADRMDRELLKRMKEVGFRSLAIGVEAGNNKVLKSIKKGETIETIEQAIKTACDLGYSTRLYFLLGSPGETPQDLEDSIRLASKYPVAEAKFSNILPFPETELYHWIEDNKLFLVEPKEYLNTIMLYDNIPVFETPEFPADERRKAFAYTRRIRKRTQQKNLKRNLVSRYGIMGRLAYPLLKLSLSEFFWYSRLFQRVRATRTYRILSEMKYKIFMKMRKIYAVDELK